jgi:hypothetical protein
LFLIESQTFGPPMDQIFNTLFYAFCQCTIFKF